MTDEDHNRVYAVIGKIVLSSPEGPDPGFSPDERRVWLLGEFNSFCNMTGFTNFFREGICRFYEEILVELRALGADAMAARLVENKQLVLGDKPLPYDDLESLEAYFWNSEGDLNEELDAKMQELDDASHDDMEEFHEIFTDYVLEGIEEGRLEG